MIHEPLEPDPRPRRFPIARLDLEEEVRRMRASPMTNGHLGKTVVHAPDIRLVLLTLRPGARLPDHRAEGSLTIHVLDGRVRVGVLDATFDLAQGQLLSIERGLSYTMEASEEAAILLGIAWPS